MAQPAALPPREPICIVAATGMHVPDTGSVIVIIVKLIVIVMMETLVPLTSAMDMIQIHRNYLAPALILIYHLPQFVKKMLRVTRKNCVVPAPDHLTTLLLPPVLWII